MFVDHIFLTISIFVVGAIFGSFLNVAIYRTGSGAGYGGRSKCLSCGKALTPWMLIPIVSFFIQRGRCQYCGAKLSWQYPLVEGAMGALFVIVLSITGFDPPRSGIPEAVFFFLHAAIWMILLGILVYDFRHKIIPDRFSVSFAALSGIVLLLKWHWGLLTPALVPLIGGYAPIWIDILAGPLLFLPFALLWALSGGRAMGLGDAKLAWGLGWFLGFTGGLSAIILAFWIAFFPSIFLLFLRRKHFTMKSEIPFAPFLILGALIVFTWGIDIFGWTF